MKNVPPEWHILSRTLRQISTIKQSRVSPGKLYQAYKKRMVFVLREKGTRLIYAFGAIWETRSDEWLEIGTIWVHPNYGNKGLSSQIITTLHKKISARKKSAFLCCSDQNKRMHGTVEGMDYTRCKNPFKSPIRKAWGIKRETMGRAIFYFRHTS